MNNENNWVTLTDGSGVRRRYNLASMTDLGIRIPEGDWGQGISLRGAYLMPRSKRVILHTFSIWENPATHERQGDGYMIAAPEALSRLYQATGDERLLPLIPDGGGAQLRDYDGNEFVIRTTNKGRFQVLPAGYTPMDMTKAEVFDTEAEARAWIARPMPEWQAFERRHDVIRERYLPAYSAVLAQPEFRGMREGIQDAYNAAVHAGKLAADMQRAAIRGAGQISSAGRDIGAVRQGLADEMARDTDGEWAVYDDARRAYEFSLQQALVAAGVPVWLFRQPVLMEDTTEGVNLRAEYEAARRNWLYPDGEGGLTRHG